MGTRFLCRGLSGRGVKLMPKASAVFKNEWIYTSTLCIRLDDFYAHNFNFSGRSKPSLSTVRQLQELQF